MTEGDIPPPGRTEVVAGCAAMALLVLWRGFRDFLHTDVSWYLYVAERFLDGSRLYVDLGDVNPPLIVYLSTPPVLASRLVGVRQDVVTRSLGAVGGLAHSSIEMASTGQLSAASRTIP